MSVAVSSRVRFFFIKVVAQHAREFVTQRLLNAGLAAKWVVLTAPMAAIVGTFCAAFLWMLERATETREAQPWLLFLLPLGGGVIGAVYAWIGKPAEGGNNLIVDQIHEPGGGIPLRMAPLIVLSTVGTHLFGGSAGREGTAVQLGGSIASAFAKPFRLNLADTRVLLTTGIAAGFGAVFGTPVAGAVFAIEVLAVGRVQYEALVPCILAAIVGDWTCHTWGITHVAYHVAFSGVPGADGITFHIDPVLLAKVAIAGVAFGIVSRIFSEASHWFGGLFKKFCSSAWLRPAIGGLAIIALTYLLGTREYLGLGVTSPDPNAASIVSFFGFHIFPWAWAWKIVFTVVTLGSGFKGGEVTPLFFIGAGLGNALSAVLGAPVDLFAALGFVAIFAGASNTPLACTIMGIELFGATNTVYIAVACFIAYLCSGHSGIYLAQRLAVPKVQSDLIPPDIALRHVRAFKPAPFNSSFSGTSFLQPLIEDQSPMPETHHVATDEIGMLRIYMAPKDRFKRPGQGRIASAFSSRELYRELVNQAKKAGLVNAIAHHTHYGFSNGGAVQSREVEGINPDLTICVEIIGHKDELETFCRQHGELLQNKVIVYKHLERWQVGKKLEETQISDLAALENE